MKIKASQLPKNSVISVYDIDSNLDVLWLNDPQGDWWSPITVARTPECIYYRDQDFIFAEGFFKIVSLPPEWYEEFRMIPGQNYYNINRAGWLRYKDLLITNGRDIVHVCGEEVLLEEAIRITFAN